LSKGLRATQLYLPNNPVYQRAVDNIRAALAPDLAGHRRPRVRRAETEVRWEDAVVYSQDNRSESVAWTSTRTASARWRSSRESRREIVRFPGVLQQAKNLQADARTTS